MRGEYRPDIQVQHCALDFLGGASHGPKLLHRPPRGRGLGRDDRLPEVCVPPPHAVRLLGGVDQEKEQSESTAGDGALGDAQVIYFSQQLVE
jgi:hypothetical protein